MEKNLITIYFFDYCDKYGIAHEFFVPKTPQHNGVVERKNRTLKKMARVMLNSKKLSIRLWTEVISTACYTINIVYLRLSNNKTTYDL